jgi:catechol 2,3-dioxygenase-like lactoylglutathione lyase family enzyme
MAFVPTANPEAAIKFYSQVLGLELIEDDSFAAVFDANGIMLRLAKLERHTPQDYTILGWAVEDIALEVRSLMEKDVQIVRYQGFEGNQLDIYTFPNGDKVAWFKDPDGNTLSVAEISKP